MSDKRLTAIVSNFLTEADGCHSDGVPRAQRRIAGTRNWLLLCVVASTYGRRVWIPASAGKSSREREGRLHYLSNERD